MKILNNIKHNQIQHDKVALTYNIKHSEIYNIFEQNRLEKSIDSCIKSINSRSSIKVLDFGAGTGNLSRIFLEKGCTVTACDVSQKSLNVLKINCPLIILILCCIMVLNYPLMIKSLILLQRIQFYTIFQIIFLL